MTGMIGFLREPEQSGAAEVLFDEDRAEFGYVMNVSRLWAYQPELVTGLAAGLPPAVRRAVTFGRPPDHGGTAEA
jgi:hypothetical protein